jgi:hypothetical protein
MADRPIILVYDRGAFVPFAQALAESGADVLYHGEWRELAPISRNALIGRDVPGIQRVDSFWSFIDEADAIVFPWTGDGDMQHWLRQKGYPVWGSGKAEMLEQDRGQFLDLLEKLGMPTPDTRRVIGLDDLEAILRNEEDLYLKTSFYRGDAETYHHETWEGTVSRFNTWKVNVGPHGREMEWLVQKPIKAKEIGYDGYSVNGFFPQRAAWGVEGKDSFYIGRTQLATEMPPCIQEANEALSDALKSLGMAGNYHNEIRITGEGQAYLTDPTCRCGSPPICTMSRWITNWTDIVMAGVKGEIVEPEFASEYAAEVALCSPWGDEHWMSVEIPEEVSPWVRLYRPVYYEGRPWCVPSDWIKTGSAIGLGPTPEAARDRAIEVAEQVKGDQLSFDKDVKGQMIQMWEGALVAYGQPEMKAA